MGTYSFGDRRNPKFWEYKKKYVGRTEITFDEYWSASISRRKNGMVFIEYPQMSLAEVDSEMAKFMKDPEPDSKTFSRLYGYVVDLGYTALYVKGGFEVKQDEVDYIISRYREANKNTIKSKSGESKEEFLMELDRMEAFLRWAFLTRFVFTAGG
jgi:hypothetical protein